MEAWIALAALTIVVAGIVYNAGRQAARLDALEKWQEITVVDLKAIRSGVDNISGAIGARKI